MRNCTVLSPLLVLIIVFVFVVVVCATMSSAPSVVSAEFAASVNISKTKIDRHKLIK